MQHGIRAALVNARTIIRRNPQCTVEHLVSVWAPPSENNTSAYLDFVCREALVAPRQKLCFRNKETMCRILFAMAQMENGRKVDFSLFLQAYDMV